MLLESRSQELGSQDKVQASCTLLNHFTVQRKEKQATKQVLYYPSRHLILIIYRTTTATLDEYTRYCLLSQHHDFEDVRTWWMEEKQKRDFPNLSRMALNILSIPAMAADPERLFSSAGLTVTKCRDHLLIKLIRALECIKLQLKLQKASISREVNI